MLQPRRWVTKLAFAFAIGSASGCAVKHEITLSAADNLNRCDRSDDSNAVVVRLYYLPNVNEFQRAKFEDIWTDPETALGRGVEEFNLTLIPGQDSTMTIKNESKAATAVGVVADFCSPDGDGWRGYLPIAGNGKRVQVKLYEGSLSIVPQ